MRKILLPSLTLSVFLFESFYVLFFSKFYEWILVPRFLFCVLFFIVLFYSRSQGFIYAVVFGLIYDVVHTEVLGVYLTLFPLLCYLMDRLMKIFHHHLIIIIFVTLLGMTGLEFFVYELNVLLQVTDMNMESFVQQRLLPTIYMNGVFLFLFSFPLKKFLLYLQARILDE
ncbi:rod shape-determining protein MreD [Bacillus oleivorans]|uniref:Rod shape-determining protein MreD n=1 Tax=Bacillus oleivorans TaxID=1448271 RepID=A0A285CWW9_9BACI|nr:rod shape-determining protein MreD [Bacillus oleivorans]SNX71568.1 rod shape-determining protein MreD [Bacillus oleivorans]